MKSKPRSKIQGQTSSEAWLVVLRFNATLTAKSTSWPSVTCMRFLAFSCEYSHIYEYQHNFSFQSHQLLFLHASPEVRGKNMPERKFASNGDQTHNYRVMSPTCSPLSGASSGANWFWDEHYNMTKILCTFCPVTHHMCTRHTMLINQTAGSHAPFPNTTTTSQTEMSPTFLKATPWCCIDGVRPVRNL